MNSAFKVHFDKKTSGICIKTAVIKGKPLADAIGNDKQHADEHNWNGKETQFCLLLPTVEEKHSRKPPSSGK